MRILHVNDAAGVAGLLAKHQSLLGHKVLVVSRDGYDGFKQKQYYGVKILGPKRRRFKRFGKLQKPLRLFNRVLNCAIFYGWIVVNSYRFDIVHIHSQYLVGLFIPFSKKVVEFHGDDIRDSPSHRWAIDKFVTGIYLRINRHREFIVSTPDLIHLLPNCIWLPNPVDTDMFKPVPHKKSNRAVYFHNWYESGNHAKVYADDHCLDLTIVDRVNLCHLFYPDMPKFLGSFDYMIDRSEIHSLSKTALEALACGVSVVDWNSDVFLEFPVQHDPMMVAKRSLEIYGNVISNKRFNEMLS